MKRILVCAALALLMAGTALGEAGGYWTDNQDLYYHANAHCCGEEERVPISRDAAQAFGKYVCPVCVPRADAGEEIQAVARGGTIVVRFSDAWMNTQSLTGVFGWSTDTVNAGDEAHSMLSQYLHGDAYNAFLADYLEDGLAEGRANLPAVLDTDGELIMNRRHIGSAWYVTVRPAENFGDEWSMYWRVNSLRLRMENGTLYSNFDQQTVETELLLKPGRMKDTAPVFEAEDSAAEIAVYRAMDANVAVIREIRADADFMKDAQLRIGGSEAGIPVEGYMSGESGIYCCVLTDGELELLRGGAGVQVWHRPLTETAEYMNTPYAGVRRGTGKAGIIDREGNFVVDALYRDISRPHPGSFRTGEPRHFFCTRMDGGVDVLHGETLEKIASFDVKKDYLRAEYENPSVFILYGGDGREVYSMQDGSFLFEMKFDETGDYSGEITDMDGYFRVRADGLPRRMVAWKGHSQAWLIDNHGARINQDNYLRITPLVWKGDEGLFLTESFAPDAYEYSFDGSLQDSYVFGNRYDGGAYGESWRCGLINQNGDTVAETEYVSVEAEESGEIRLTDEAGEVHIFQIGN